jgi:hypothetical protein
MADILRNLRGVLLGEAGARDLAAREAAAPPRAAVQQPRRVRLPSLTKVQRDNPGKRVAVTYRRDGSRTYAIDDKAAASDADLTEWDREFGPSAPPQVRRVAAGEPGTRSHRRQSACY